jgi:hypothetical protein
MGGMWRVMLGEGKGELDYYAEREDIAANAS